MKKFIAIDLVPRGVATEYVPEKSQLRCDRRASVDRPPHDHGS
jgi:hypothetical protein